MRNSSPEKSMLIMGIRKQIRLLDELISKVTEEKDLQQVGWFYDAATKEIERNLMVLGKTLRQKPFRNENPIPNL